jgi:hypothetical protein
VGGDAIGATFPSHSAGVVALAARGAIGATKPALTSVHFVASTPPTSIGATLRTHCVNFVARTRGRRTRATKCTLTLPTQPQLTFATTLR